MQGLRRQNMGERITTKSTQLAPLEEECSDSDGGISFNDGNLHGSRYHPRL